MGITVDEYMNQVEAYEKEQEKAKELERIEEMVNNGVPEETAREVIAAGQMRKKYQQMENELKRREEELNKEAEKNKEYEDFLDRFPDVKAEDIPKEVFEDAENSSLSEAYMKWKLKDLENQLSVAKTNEKNAKTSVGGITETGPTEQKKEIDPFLDGLING
jgi:16S rRNA C967 or C1407 C5-methylase (RsmB/RsmF family)